MGYSLFNKSIEDVVLSDIEELKTREVGEGWYVEYKQFIPVKSSKLDNVKIAKSISAFANTKGGWIVWGVECDNKNKPVSIDGIDISSFDNFEDSISQLINSNIDPRPYYHFKSIYLDSGNVIFVIYVEPSPTPPYITSQGVIYQRENNESKPIGDRYILEKLKEKTDEYFKAIDEFSELELTETKGQGDAHQTFLELYLFPLPFDGFHFKKFYKSEFFKEVAVRFYQSVELNSEFGGEEFTIPLNLGFNSIYSSEGSLIIRPLKKDNLIYRSTTVELFENGNLKFLIPLNEFDINRVPSYYRDSEIVEYLKEKYGTDFANHVKLIDGIDLILKVLVIITKYKEVLKDNDFDFSSKIGLRSRITDVWRKFIFFDDSDYLDKIKNYNIPLAPKNDIEIPSFYNGNHYMIDFDHNGTFFQIAKFVMEGIGLPDSESMDFINIFKEGLERFRNRHNYE